MENITDLLYDWTMSQQDFLREQARAAIASGRMANNALSYHPGLHKLFAESKGEIEAALQA